MATIIISHRTTVAMTNSIHALLSENHPWTLFMVSLHPGYHDPPIPIHYHMPRIDDGDAPGGVLSSASGQYHGSFGLACWEPWLIHTPAGAFLRQSWNNLHLDDVNRYHRQGR